MPTKQPVVLLGVTGGIAAYKAAELLRGLQKSGMEVRVMMTPTATSFVGPLTFQALSGYPVFVSNDEHALRDDSTITHVEEAKADIMVIAPATANTIAKMANGITDNVLTAAYLAYRGPVVVAPAMNAEMWNHPATQRNVSALRHDGVVVVQPGVGALACGSYGSGRMAEPSVIIAEVKLRLQMQRKTDMRGLHVLVTAGGTREPIDAVRYVGNRSSGKMGFALARSALDRGASVDLVRANVDLSPIPGVRETYAATAAEMHNAVMDRLPVADVLIMAAAVADYQPAEESADAGKMAKSQDDLIVRLEPTTDILAAVGMLEPRPFLVGFAAEYGMEGLARARAKLERKGLDMIVFNDISRADIGFGSDHNEVVILSPDSEIEVKRSSKERIAEVILDQVARRLKVQREELLPIT